MSDRQHITPHSSDDERSNPAPVAIDSRVGTEDNERAWIEGWLSAPRFAPYLSACAGKVSAALDLYLWNVGLCQVLMADISHFEVALRNAYDRTLRKSWGGERHWLLDDSSPVRAPILRTSRSKRILDVNVANRKAISQARGRAHDSNDPDQIISNLMLGFWAHLTDRSRERDLWIPHLHGAWPAGTDRAGLHRQIYAINKVRNRVAHNERLFDPVRDEFLPTAVDAGILRLLNELSPQAADALYEDSHVSPVELYVRCHPVPADVRI